MDASVMPRKKEPVGTTYFHKSPRESLLMLQLLWWGSLMGDNRSCSGGELKKNSKTEGGTDCNNNIPSQF